jgi:hypothetical protein
MKSVKLMRKNRKRKTMSAKRKKRKKTQQKKLKQNVQLSAKRLVSKD